MRKLYKKQTFVSILIAIIAYLSIKNFRLSLFSLTYRLQIMYAILDPSSVLNVINWSVVLFEQIFFDPVLLNNTLLYQNISCSQLEECNTWIYWFRFQSAKLSESYLLNMPDVIPGSVMEYTENDSNKYYLNPFVIRKAALNLSTSWGYDENKPDKMYKYLKQRFGKHQVLVYKNQTNDILHAKSNDFYYIKLEYFIDILQEDPSILDTVIFDDTFREDYMSDLVPYVKKVTNLRVVTSHLFMGNKKSGSHWHYNQNSNIFIQVYGSKHWCFIKKYNWIYMRSLFRPVVFARSMVNSKILRKIPKTCVTLYPGDILFNPGFTWHEVENKDNFNLGIANRIHDFQKIDNRKTQISILRFFMEDGEDENISIDQYE